MSRRRLLVILLAVLLVGCCLLGVLSIVIVRNVAPQAFSTDEARAATVGAKIVDYELPAGYREQASLDLFYQMVVIASVDSDMMIMLMQMPTFGASREEMERQMQQSFAAQTGSANVTWEWVEDREVQIRGETVTLTVHEGEGSYGRSLRREMGVFPGKGGLVMLMVMGSRRGWDAAALDELLASMR